MNDDSLKEKLQPAPETDETPGIIQPSSDSVSSVDIPPTQTVAANNGGKKRRWLKALIILLVAALLAGGGWWLYENHQNNSKKTGEGQSKIVPSIKVGVYQADFGELYPNMTPSSYALMVNSQIFEGLVRYENTNKIVPDLASKWSNPDGKTWLFTIKPNVKFHDGRTLSPKDVKYSIDTVIANNPDLAELFANTIDSVEVVGNSQVKITTKDPDPVLLNRLSVLYVVDANAPKGGEPSQAGTGPYRIKPGTKASPTELKMIAFDGYHGGKPTTRALEFSASSDASQLVKDFQGKKFNIAGPVPVQDTKKVKGAYKFISSEPNVDYIGFNTVKAGPLQNKLVREAIRYAVDSKAIGKANLNQTVPISQVITPSIPGYNPAIKPYKQNVNKAKQLLAKAGYPNGISITLSVPSDLLTAPELVKELKQAGIKVTLDRHNDFNEFIDYFNGGHADMFVINYSSDTLDGLDTYRSVFGEANYNNPKLTALLGQIGATSDPAKRLELLQEAATIINDDAAVVPLYSENNIWLMDRDYQVKQDMPSSFMSVYFYKVGLK